MSIYFIGDLHLGHTNCLKFENRPFSSIEVQDERILANWNMKVTEKDTVYILGDFSFYKVDKTLSILKKLNGKKVLIKGNHDKWANDIEQVKSEIKVVISDFIKYNKYEIYLSHYPTLVWPKKHYGALHLYAHIHDNSPDITYNRNINNLMENAYNVGCMLSYMGYTPRTLEEIIDGVKSECK